MSAPVVVPLPDQVSPQLRRRGKADNRLLVTLRSSAGLLRFASRMIQRRVFLRDLKESS